MGGALSVNEGFFAAFKLASEEMWSNKSIRENVWGFQLQPGTRWNPGLSDEEIREYEAVVDISFPSVFCTYLREMNGTDKPAIDIRGNSGENHRFGPGFYSYPRDMEAIHKMIRHAWADASQLRETLLDEGFCLPDDAKLVPIYSHRFVVCSSRLDAGWFSRYGTLQTLSFMEDPSRSTSKEKYFSADLPIPVLQRALEFAHEFAGVGAVD